ncbi:MAG TPA: hypothetical protein VIL12_01415 [Acidimicrobiia bacterium]
MPGRKIGSLLVGIGVSGLLTAGLVAVIGWALVGEAADDFRDVLLLSGTTLESVSATLDVGDEVLATAGEAIATGTALVGDAQGTLRSIAEVTADMEQLVTDDVPAAIDSVRVALPPLASTAAIVDTVMGALSVVGVAYDPDVSLDDAISAIDEELAAIPPLLRAQQEPLSALQEDLLSFADRTGEVGVQFEGLSASIEESRSLVADYEAGVAEGSRLIEDALDQLHRQRRLARILVLAVAGALAISQAASLVVGWSLRKGRPLLAGDNSPSVEATAP